MTGAFVVAIAVGALVVMIGFGRYRHREVLRDWSGILSPEGARTVEAVEDHAAMDRHMADEAWGRAMIAQESREWAEAVRLLELAYWVIEDATPARLERLRAMTRVCRQAAAVLPMPAIQTGAFRLGRLRTLAGAGAALHAILVAPTERIVLRTRLLAAGLRMALWTMRRARAGAAHRPERGKAWRAFDAALADWKTLDVEHLHTYRAAMMVLAAELRREVPVTLS